VITQCIVPFGEIFEIRIDAAVTERCRRRTLVRFFKGSAILGVAKGAIRDSVLAFLKNHCVIHFEGCKNSRMQKVTVRFA